MYFKHVLIKSRYFHRWLHHVYQLENDVVPQDASWAAYHATHPGTAKKVIPAVVALLPLFPDEAKSAAMIKHSMDMIHRTVQTVNPGQIPVIAVDQPLFAVAKQVQWQWPISHGESKFVMMFGGLHLEMAFLKVLGKWIEGSGWVESLIQAGIASSGVADSFLKAVHVTRTRRAHQVTVCALYTLLAEAYQSYLESLSDSDNQIEMMEWVNEQKQKYPTFHYWMTVLNMQLLLMIFVRCQREGNFLLYLETLIQMVPWFFAMDHQNYARWISIHIKDMINIKTVNPDVYAKFLQGCFVVTKTSRRFSAIPLDQAHEQNNALIKGDGGAIGLTENAAALRRWMVGGPEVSRVIEEFEAAVFECQEVSSHYEETPATQNAFTRDVSVLSDSIRKSGNPFQEETEDLLVLQSRDIIDPAITNSLFEVEAAGVHQYDEFVQQRLTTHTKPLYDPIKQNKFPRISSTVSKQTKPAQIATLKQDCNLFAGLYISSQSKQGHLDRFYVHKNQPYPPAL